MYGVALSTPPEVMYPAVAARARRVSEQLRQATLERLRERGVHLVRGEARLDGEAARSEWSTPPSSPRSACRSPSWTLPPG